jgi:hypothetical protein
MLKVRKLKKYDWDFLPKWWEKYNQEPWLYTENFKDILPNLGFLVHNEKQPIAAMWLGLTNSNSALPTAAISDPKYRGKDRKDAISFLLSHVTNHAKELGFKYAFAWAQEGYMLDYYLKLDYEKFENPSYELIKKL